MCTSIKARISKSWNKLSFSLMLSLSLGIRSVDLTEKQLPNEKAEMMPNNVYDVFATKTAPLRHSEPRQWCLFMNKFTALVTSWSIFTMTIMTVGSNYTSLHVNMNAVNYFFAGLIGTRKCKKSNFWMIM